MIQLLDDAVHWQRGEAGKLQFNPAALDLVGVLSRILVEELRSSLKTPHDIAFIKESM